MTGEQAKLFQLRIKELRRAAKLTQNDMAEKFYITRSCWSNYERGYRVPPIELVCQIADFFDIDIRYLIDSNNLHSDVDDFIKQKNDARKYITKDGCLSLSELPTVSKIAIIDFYRFLVGKDKGKGL